MSDRRDSAALAVDVGGTFTDAVGWDGVALRSGKVASTPEDQSHGVVSGAELVSMSPDRFLHGTTVATNALLEGRGARTALITSPGFADVIEIGRQDRPSLYDSFDDRAIPLVERALRLEAGDDFADPLAGAEAVAISLLYGYRRSSEEAAIAAAISRARPDLAISMSSDVVPEFREYERTVTTVLNAYLMPETGRYLASLVARAEAAGLPEDIQVMRSSGGLMPIGQAVSLPASILLSGPAGGVVAAGAIGEALGRDRLVSFDMGGTSTDVCRIDGGRPEVSYERPVAGYPCRMPAVAVHTVGAGGGSIGWVDDGGSLRVGPRSAGAQPGPACYGNGGTEPAVTDANVVLGRIDPGGVLAGSLPMIPRLAAAAIESIGDRLGMDSAATALGIVEVIEEVMAGAVRAVSIEQGADPRRAVLVAFGGAGGLHATALAKKLDMAGVVIPPYSGVFSALGLLLSPPRIDVARSTYLVDGDDLDGTVASVVTEASRRLADGGSDEESTSGFADIRYQGQSHETTVPYRPGEGWPIITDRFHRMHKERNGFSRRRDLVEVVTVRAESVGRPLLTWSDMPEIVAEGSPIRPPRTVLTRQGPVDATVWNRAGLSPGDEVTGPAVLEETDATTYLAPGDRATVHESGALEVEW